VARPKVSEIFIREVEWVFTNLAWPDGYQGLGLHLQRRAQEPAISMLRDLHETHRSLGSLTEYEHLHRIARLCHVHVHRKIKTAQVPDSVKGVMRSLMCVTHDDWRGALERICTEGGKVGTGESDFMILN
jgi:hypothetical protein